MKRDSLTDSLRSLPRVGASEGFTNKVLLRLDEPSSRREGHWVRPLLAAAALATVVAGLFLVYSPSPPASQEQTVRLEVLESERDRLEQELTEIRSLLEQAPPREIYLGGNDRLEVVFDVGWSAVQKAATEGRRSNTTQVVPSTSPMLQSAAI